MELQEKSKIDIQFYLGNKFKYVKHPISYIKSTVTVTDHYGKEYYFTNLDNLILVIVDFLCDVSGSDYKLKFIYNGETVLTKWYTEEEIIYAIQNDWFKEVK
jgi:hypothetical protein